MNKEEIKKQFEKNVNYLKRNVPPDDIYLFTEQTFMAALYFLHKWSEWVDVEAECQDSFVTRKWVTNVLGLQRMKDQNIDVNLDLNLESIEEDE